MTKMLARLLVASLVALAVVLPAGAALPPHGSISGIARDVFDSPLTGFGVRLRSLATGEVPRATTTDAQGVFVFTHVDPGGYVVELVDPAMRLVATTGTLSMASDHTRISGLIIVPAGVVVPRRARFVFDEAPGTKNTTAGAGVVAAMPGGGAGLFGASASKAVFAASDAGINVGIFGSVRSKSR